jgi:hypothetical protein
MEKRTHLYLAERIHAALEEILPVAPPLPWFRIANILPDYTLLTFTRPHFAPLSTDFIAREIQRLAEWHIDPETGPGLAFTIRLGRITHYLCDYFCQVHLNGRLIDVMEHIRYERALDGAIQSDPSRFNEVSRLDSVHAPRLADGLKCLLSRALAEHAGMEPGFDRDVCMAVRFASGVARALVRQCLFQGSFPEGAAIFVMAEALA